MPKKAKKEAAGKAGANKKGNQMEDKLVANVNIKTKGNLKDKIKTRKESGRDQIMKITFTLPKGARGRFLLRKVKMSKTKPMLGLSRAIMS